MRGVKRAVVEKEEECCEDDGKKVREARTIDLFYVQRLTNLNF